MLTINSNHNEGLLSKFLRESKGRPLLCGEYKTWQTCQKREMREIDGGRALSKAANPTVFPESPSSSLYQLANHVRLEN